MPAPQAQTRVVHLTSAHPRTDVRIFHKQCKSLAQAGYDVHLCVADGLGDAELDKVHIHSIERPTGRLQRMLLKPLQVWSKARQLNAAVYHFHDPELIFIGLLLRLSGKKVIYDVHEDVPRDILTKAWIPGPLRSLIAFTVEHVENFAARCYSAIVAATPHIAARFARVQPKSVDINNFPILSELLSIERPSSIEPTARTVCYVGGISRVRGAIEMIQAIELADARLIMAGPIETESLRKELESLPGWRKVDYRGVVGRDAVRQIYSESQLGLVLLHPIANYLDSLPVKMFEYMAAALPSLASDFPLWKDILEPRNAGRCTAPLDVAGVAQQIDRMLDDPALSLQMGKNGRQAVIQTYNWGLEEAKLVALYGQLAPLTPEAR